MAVLPKTRLWLPFQPTPLTVDNLPTQTVVPTDRPRQPPVTPAVWDRPEPTLTTPPTQATVPPRPGQPSLVPPSRQRPVAPGPRQPPVVPTRPPVVYIPSGPPGRRQPELPPVGWTPRPEVRPVPRPPVDLLPPPVVHPRPPMIPCPPPVPCPGPPPVFSAPPRGVEPICNAPLGAHEEVMTNNRCRPRPCPPPTSAPRPLPASGCVATAHGNTRGGIFDAPWVGADFADAARQTVPTNCPTGSGTPLPGVATGPHPRYAPSPYGRPQVVPGPCPPPCPPDPCMSQGRPVQPPTGVPITPPERTPIPIPVPPARIPPTTVTGRPGLIPPPARVPSTPPGGNFKVRIIPPPPGIVPTPANPAPWTRVPIIPPPPGLVCPDNWQYNSSSQRCEPPALKGFGAVPSARTSGIFDIPRCNAGPGVPYAGSPYSDPRIMPAPCPPRPCPPNPCGDGNGNGVERRPTPVVVVPEGRPECTPRPVAHDCPPGPRFPVVSRPEPCAGFGAGPDGLGFWR